MPKKTSGPKKKRRLGPIKAAAKAKAKAKAAYRKKHGVVRYSNPWDVGTKYGAQTQSRLQRKKGPKKGKETIKYTGGEKAGPKGAGVKGKMIKEKNIATGKTTYKVPGGGILYTDPKTKKIVQSQFKKKLGKMTSSWGGKLSPKEQYEELERKHIWKKSKKGR